MRGLWKFPGWLVALMLFGAVPVQAQEVWPSIDVPGPSVAAGSRDGALIVSIEEYADKFMPPVAGARQSGQDWQQWFTKSRGIKASRVRWLEDREATRGAILRELEALSKEIGAQGNIWVIFVGHGAASQDGREGIVLGWGAQARDEYEFYGQSVRHSELEKTARVGNPKKVVMVLDACFSGKSSAGDALLVGKQPALLVQDLRVSPRVLMLTAAQKDEFAGQLPGAQRPAFSYLVLGALRGWADENRDGEITANEVVAYVQDSLKATARGQKQTPQVIGDGNFVLASLQKSQLERGPDLGEIQVALRGGSTTAPTPAAPPGVMPGDVDLGFDLQNAQALVAFHEKLEAARQLEAAPNRAPEDKARAWDAVAHAAVQGQDAVQAQARQQATTWRQVAQSRSKMRAQWAELSAGLSLPSLTTPQKKLALERFIAGYERLGAEPELLKAREALKVLEAGGSLAKKPAPEGFVRIEPGRFTMGSPLDEPGRSDDERSHEVQITQAFDMATTPVTQGQWKAVMGSNPSHFKNCGADCPVEEVSWEDSVRYLNKLSARERLQKCYNERTWRFVGLHCKGYRLPTEAEWEYAARAGTTGAYYGELNSVAWYVGNSAQQTHPVGQKTPNAWGLYDMLGNVGEWVGDWYQADYGSQSVTDPLGPATGADRVFRGSSWYTSAQLSRVATRKRSWPNRGYIYVGLRVVKSVIP